MTTHPFPDLEIEAQLQRLCMEFANALDAHDHTRTLATLAPEAVMATPAGEARGLAQIEKTLRARPTAMVTRHICTNFQLLSHTGERATGVCYVTCFKRSSQTPPPLRTPLPLVAEYHDDYIRTDAGWRVLARRIVLVFDPDLPDLQ